jgi:hypothetical protein
MAVQYDGKKTAHTRKCGQKKKFGPPLNLLHAYTGNLVQVVFGGGGAH